jgi:starch phosphorylase
MGFNDGVGYNDIADRLIHGDEYLLLADFDSYCKAHTRSIETYADREQWNRMSLINVARSGIFAADRSIADYAHDIWNVPTRK